MSLKTELESMCRHPDGYFYVQDASGKYRTPIVFLCSLSQDVLNARYGFRLVGGQKECLVAEILRGFKMQVPTFDVYEEEECVFFEDLSGEVLQDDELARLLTFPNVIVTADQPSLDGTGP